MYADKIHRLEKEILIKIAKDWKLCNLDTLEEYAIFELKKTCK